MTPEIIKLEKERREINFARRKAIAEEAEYNDKTRPEVKMPLAFWIRMK